MIVLSLKVALSRYKQIIRIEVFSFFINLVVAALYLFNGAFKKHQFYFIVTSLVHDEE